MLAPGKDYNYIAQCHHITPVENKTPYYFAIKIADEDFLQRRLIFGNSNKEKRYTLLALSH